VNQLLRVSDEAAIWVNAISAPPTSVRIMILGSYEIHSEIRIPVKNFLDPHLFYFITFQ